MIPHALLVPASPSKVAPALGRAREIVNRLPGVALVGALAIVAIEVGRIGWLQTHGISALTLAIVLGIIVGNTLYPRIAAVSASGVSFSRNTLLRTGIILYGLRLTFQDIAGMGVAGVAIDAIVLSSTFALAWWAGTRVFGLDRRTAMLIGAGSSICGAAAVMATEPVLRGRPDQVAVAISTVVVFGTLAIFLYPALYHLNARYDVLAMTPSTYGIFAGSTIHEVAQVLAAGRAVSDTAAHAAVITKMVRVMMLAPFLVLLSSYLSRCGNDDADSTHTGQSARGIVIPRFALGFVAATALNSAAVLPEAVVGAVVNVDTVVLAMAMAALGVTTHVSAIRTAGIKPLALAATLFAWLVLGGIAINAGVSAVFG